MERARLSAGFLMSQRKGLWRFKTRETLQAKHWERRERLYEVYGDGKADEGH